MTWITTHLALEGMIAFIFIGTSLRTKFLHSNSTKGLFLLANLFAIIPDFDVYIGILFGNRMHRGPSHSIFFPLTFVVIGLILLLYNKRRTKKKGDPLSDVEGLFRAGNNDTWNQILYLLPYVFFLAAFYWGMHIVLDQDAAEGGMMMFWPLDNRLYEIQLVFTLNANPILFLPWQPLSATFQVSQSTIIGLYNYLFNWTPQDFLNYYGTTVFTYTFVGLVLHSLIFMTWVYFVLRPMWPFTDVHLAPANYPNITSNNRIIRTFQIIWYQIIRLLNYMNNLLKSIYSHSYSYWHAIVKELLIPGIILAIIGFSFGPLITPQVPDSQSISSNLNLTNSTFNALTYVPINSIDQPLDPNAQFLITANYNTSNFRTGESLYFIVAQINFFTYLQNQISSLGSSISSNNKPANDTNFKENYNSIINTSFELYAPWNTTIISTNQTNVNSKFSVLSSKSWGVGFVLKNWISKQFWNETNTQLLVSGNINLVYTRYVNYWLGVAIEISGLLMTGVALVLPFKRKKENPAL